MRRFVFSFAVVTHLLLLDQIVKVYAIQRLKGMSPVEVTPFFNLAYVENRGCAWGMLQGQVWPLAVFAAIAFAFLVWKRKSVFSSGTWGWIAEHLLYAGILGNLIDRLHYRFVVDMFDFHWGVHHFPCFNVADACITVSAAILLAFSAFAKDLRLKNVGVRIGGRVRRHWFFDFDGTLARTGEDIVLAWKKSISDMGLSCPHFDKVFRIGPTLEKMAHELFDNVTPELLSELTERFKPNYDESGFPNTAPYPGVPEMLRTLKDGGAKIYIVTNKRHAATQKIVKAMGWDGLFDGVWSFDTFPEAKYKKPDLLSRLLKEMNVSPEDAVMVGDTKGDIDAGKANGVYTIGVSWGYGARKEFSEADDICELN